MTFQRAPRLLAQALGVAVLGCLPLAAAEPPVPLTPRAARIAERIYARQAIAEARAARAEARAAEIANVVPEPPPPRPITLRRMARAGVPLGAPPQTVIIAKEMPPVTRAPAAVVQTPSSVRQPRASVQPPAVVKKPAASPAPATTASRAPAGEPGHGVWTLDPDPARSPVVESDGTRSVLATGGETPPPPAATPADVDRPGPAVTQPPIELLPTPPAE